MSEPREDGSKLPEDVSEPRPTRARRVRRPAASPPARAPGAPRARRPARAGAPAQVTRVSARDLEILTFAAEHRFVLAAQVQTLLGVSRAFAHRRLSGLADKGLVASERLVHDQPTWYRITGRGLSLIGRELPTPRFDLRSYRHDIGLGWVWLAASRGAFGRVGAMVSEREMRSRDGRGVGGRGGTFVGGEADGPRGEAGAPRADGHDPLGGDGHDPLGGSGHGELGRGGHDPLGDETHDTFGVRVGGVGPRGRIGLHYPDLLLMGEAGERVAVELELTAKGSRRLEKILLAYAADSRISAVLYLIEQPALRRQVQSAAARLGISDLVHVREVAWPAARGAGASATPSRVRTAQGRGAGPEHAGTNSAATPPARGRPTARVDPPTRLRPPADRAEALTR